MEMGRGRSGPSGDRDRGRDRGGAASTGITARSSRAPHRAAHRKRFDADRSRRTADSPARAAVRLSGSKTTPAIVRRSGRARPPRWPVPTSPPLHALIHRPRAAGERLSPRSPERVSTSHSLLRLVSSSFPRASGGRLSPRPSARVSRFRSSLLFSLQLRGVRLVSSLVGRATLTSRRPRFDERA